MKKKLIFGLLVIVLMLLVFGTVTASDTFGDCENYQTIVQSGPGYKKIYRSWRCNWPGYRYEFLGTTECELEGYTYCSDSWRQWYKRPTPTPMPKPPPYPYPLNWGDDDIFGFLPIIRG